MKTVNGYYFWKWADNDLPGNPVEVYTSLVHGRPHPAVQCFDAAPFLSALARTAAEGGYIGEEWEWRVHPANGLESAIFVFVTGPRLDSSEVRRHNFAKRYLPLGLSGYDESTGTIIDGLLPKLNCFWTGQKLSSYLYNVTVEEVARLLRSVDHNSPDPFGIPLDGRNHFVQFWSYGRRFAVEWRANYDFRDWTKFDQWRVQDAKRLAATDRLPPYKGLALSKDPDLVCYGTAVRIFEAFLKREQRPENYPWRNINVEL